MLSDSLPFISLKTDSLVDEFNIYESAICSKEWPLKRTIPESNLRDLIFHTFSYLLNKGMQTIWKTLKMLSV